MPMVSCRRADGPLGGCDQSSRKKIESECLIENMYIGLLVAYSAVREVLMHDGMSSNRIHLSWTPVRVYLVPLAVSFFGCCL